MGPLLLLGGIGAIALFALRKKDRRHHAELPMPGDEMAAEFEDFARINPGLIAQLTNCLNGACSLGETQGWIIELAQNGYPALSQAMAITAEQIMLEEGALAA